MDQEGRRTSYTAPAPVPSSTSPASLSRLSPSDATDADFFLLLASASAPVSCGATHCFCQPTAVTATPFSLVSALGLAHFRWR